jgi:hypothetical protein
MFILFFTKLRLQELELFSEVFYLGHLDVGDTLWLINASLLLTEIIVDIGDRVIWFVLEERGN